MKEPIQTSSDEVAIVVYDSPLPPKYFRLTKRFIKTFLVAVPLLIVLLIISFFLWGLGSRLKDVPTPKLPSAASETENKIRSLENAVRTLQESNNSLSEKVASSSSIATTEDPNLLLIKKPYGMQNLLAKNSVSLDQFELINKENNLQLKFQIISSSPERKVTGHVLVFMLSDSGLVVYPREANSLVTQGIKYTSGESFSVSRLRPTTANFAARPAGESVKFIVYIFNREGDLLLIKETESFKVGAKS